ncbi:MAG: DUF1573 domain-containing protein [bacterium]
MNTGVDAQMKVSPASLNFGEHLPNSQGELSFYIANRGNSKFKIKHLRPASSAFVLDDTTVSIAPEDSYRVAVAFAPGRAGPFDSELRIVNNPSEDSVATVELLGWVPVEINQLLTPATFSKKISFAVATPREVLLHLTANSNTNWAIPDTDSAVLTVFVDENYQRQNQDVVLFGGEKMFDYKLSLGRLEAGDHTLEFYFDDKKSAPGAKLVYVAQCAIIPVTRLGDEYDVFRYSPILFGRDLFRAHENNATDTPILLYHEIFHAGLNKWIQYTMIWSNEDQGTNAVDLMSRWGRTTDIEWIYRVELDARGNLLDDYFQGEDHETLPFIGSRVADHPVLKTITYNNMVHDLGTSDLKFFLSPERSKAKNSARETVMDENPWTYEIMTKEMIKENQYEFPGNPLNKALSLSLNYLYLEFFTLVSGDSLRLTFGLRLTDDKNWYYSDHGDRSVAAVNRGGWRRSSIELPAETTLTRLDSLQILASGTKDFSIMVGHVSKIFMLDGDFELRQFPLLWPYSVQLNRTHRKAVFSFDTLRHQTN